MPAEPPNTQYKTLSGRLCAASKTQDDLLATMMVEQPAAASRNHLTSIGNLPALALLELFVQDAGIDLVGP